MGLRRFGWTCCATGLYPQTAIIAGNALMSMRVQSAIFANLIGALVAFVFAGLYFRADLESIFNPVLTETRTEYISRDGGVLRFRVEFYKARSGVGVLNSWKMDATGRRDGGEVFFTPENCGGEPLTAGVSPVGTHQKRELCAAIPRSLAGKPFHVIGMTIYKLDSGFTVPVRFPEMAVPAE